MHAEQPADLIRYTGSSASDGAYHDGGLRPAVGVQLWQVSRGEADGTAPDGAASIIRHHPMLTHFQNRHLVQYLPEGEAVLAYSDPGDPQSWRYATPFPKVTIGGNATGTHGRMAFYQASNGKLLTSVFYGTLQGVNNGQGGFARVIREVQGFDAAGQVQLGPAYAALYNDGYSQSNTPWQPYTTSIDTGFKSAVSELMANPLYMQQWYEEQHTKSNAGSLFVADDAKIAGSFEGKAFSWWTLPDGRIAAIWKGPQMTVTKNGSDGWTEANVPNEVYSDRQQQPDGTWAGTVLKWHGTSKIWGQQLSDGTYALVGNYQQTKPDGRRMPLVVSTSADGLNFNSDALAIAGDVPIMRYPDAWPVDHKDTGLQYVRGITPGNGTPDDGAMWLTFSSNKEDIWLARVPVSIRGSVQGPVHDDFQGMTPGGIVTDWNIRSGQWAPVKVVDDGGNQLLRLRDSDPYDYAKAVRVFAQSQQVRLDLRVRAGQRDHGALFIDVNNATGKRPVQLALLPDGTLRASNGPAAAPLTLSASALSSYSNQDGQSTAFAIEDAGRTLALTGNSWKKTGFNYTITPNTVLAFDFMSTREGELHAIGFDTDNGTPLTGGFKLFGTESTSLSTYYDDYRAGSGWRPYRIDMGHFFTGNVSQMVFINDHDSGTPKGDSRFRDVVVFENDGSALTVLRQYAADEWLDISLVLDAATGRYDVRVNGELLGENLAFAEAVDSVERIELRTGPYMLTDMARRPVGELLGFYGSDWLTTTLPGADTPVNPAVFDLDSFNAIPEPTTLAPLAAAALLLARRRPTPGSR